MKKVLLTSGIAVLALATIVSAATVFNTNLTVGSTGADVVALQTWLLANGYSIPAISSGAAAKGYFGSQTKAAVQAYQKAVGVPSTGFVGPLTRGQLNSSATATTNTTVTVNCPAGYVCTPIAGNTNTTTTTTTVVPTAITTIGAEGLIATKLAASPIADSNIRVAKDVPIYGIEVKAQSSDMKVDRVLLEMSVGIGSATASLSNPAGFITKLYAYDGSTLLKSWDVTAASFNKDSSDRYYIIASGMSFIVPKDATKVITFKVDTIGVSSDQSSRYLTVQGYSGNTQNVRAVDGVGLNSYTDMSGSSNSRVQTFTTSGSSTVTVTVNSALTPQSTTNRVTSDGIKLLNLQSFDIKSETGNSIIKKVYAAVNATSSSGIPSTLYLYDGSNLVNSQSTVAGDGTVVAFTNLSVLVPKDTIKTLTLKGDFASTVSGQAASSSVAANGIQWEKPDSTTASTTNSELAGNDQYLYSQAPVWQLVSANTTVAGGVKDVSSSSLSAVIVLKATAIGGAMTKPVASDFGFVFASTTRAASAYSSGNSIPVLPTIAVTPTDATVGDGGVYTVTLNGILSSGTSTTVFNPSLGTSYSEYAAVKSISSTVGTTIITNQTWGIDTFFAPAQALARGTF